MNYMFLSTIMLFLSSIHKKGESLELRNDFMNTLYHYPPYPLQSELDIAPYLFIILQIQTYIIKQFTSECSRAKHTTE